MSSRSTVFLVPGLTGTQLRDCTSQRLLWLNPELMLDCPASLMEYLDLHYDSTTKSFTSIRGVAAGGDIGDLQSIKIITEPPMDIGGQFDQFIRYLIAIGGYVEGKDLFGVPYDWRLILDPTYWRSLSLAVKEEIERRTGGCSNTRATIIGFSLGCLITTRFLREQSQEWRIKYIKRVIFVGAPLGGCPKAFISVCGTIDDLPGYNTPCVKKFLQRCSGAFICHPVPDCFPELLIIKNAWDCESKTGKSYKVADIVEAYRHPLFRIKSAIDIYSDYGEFINTLSSKGLGEDVELHIVYSSVRDTTVALDYQDGCQGHKVKESSYYRELLQQQHQETIRKKYREDPCSSRRRAAAPVDQCCLPCEEEEEEVIVGDGMIPHISLAYWDKKTYANGRKYAASVKCFKGYQYEHPDLFNRIDVIKYVFNLLEVSCLDHRLKPYSTGGSTPA